MSSSNIKFETIDHYVSTLPPEVQTIVEEIRKTVRGVAPEAVEAISYNMPAYKLHGQSLIHFAAWKKHIGFYPMPPEGTDIYQDLLPYLDSKATIRFPLNKPTPYELIARLVTHRMAGLEPKRTNRSPL